MRKIFVSLFLIISLLLTALFHPASASTVHAKAQSTKAEIISGTSESEEILSEYNKNVNRSVELYSQAMSPYKTRIARKDNQEIVAYNDNFAGAFIDDDGFLNICSVGKDKGNNSFKEVKYKQYTYSYNYLQKIHEVLLTVMQEYTISSIATAEKFNQVHIELNDEHHIRSIINFLQERGLYSEAALKFTIISDGGVLENATAYGGDKIHARLLGWIAVGGGSICVNAIDNETGKYGVLTNQHVAKNNTMYNDDFFGWNKFGKASKSQNGGTIDAAFIPFENQKEWSITQHARYDSTKYTNVMLGNENLIIEGAPVKRIGQTTGITTGTIKSKSSSEKTEDGNTITQVIRYSNVGEGGDSGGPVYFDSGNQNLFLIGMHFGSLANRTAGVACRISEIMSAFNITPITSDTIWEHTEFLKLGTYTTSQVEGTQISLIGNVASFGVSIQARSVATGGVITRNFTVEGKGTYTALRSPTWTQTGNLNKDHVLTNATITFETNYFRIAAPGAFNTDFLDTNNIFEKITIYVTHTPPNQNTISGNTISFISPSQFALDDWSTIETVASSGNASSIYSVGDEKIILLTTGEAVTLQILGFNHDNLTGGGKAGITIGIKNVLDSPQRMNAAASNVGGWSASNMRNVTLPNIFSKLPQSLQSIIRPVDKITTSGSGSTALQTTSDKLFLFSFHEISGQMNATYVAVTEGLQYQYWKSPANGGVIDGSKWENRIRNLANGDGANWWFRSPDTSTSAGFCRTGMHGSFAGADANTSFRGLTFGFCVGTPPSEPIPAPISFVSDSWATIETVASSGNARQYYSIGDEKNITLSTGEQVTLQILGFSHDNLSSGGKAGISIGMKGLLSTTYRMNPTNSNASGWNASEMRNVTLPTIFNQLPVGLQNVIKTVSKQATEGTMSTNLITSQDKLFLFSEYEVTGQLHATEAPIQEGTQYEYWRTVKNGAVSADRIKQLGNTGVAHKWWLRSPRMGDTTRFREVNDVGAIWWNSTNQLSAVTFGFCI